MTLLLRVVSGARTGHVLNFASGVPNSASGEIRIGRDARAELQFDPERDLEVSAQHAVIRRDADGWQVEDSASRNGTFVNDRRISGPQRLRDGDRIAFGEGGPVVEVRLLDAAGTRAFGAPVRDGTTQRIRAEVARRTRAWKVGAAVFAAGVCAVTAMTLTGMYAERRAWEQERAGMLARIDSAVAAGDRTIRGLEGELSGLADSLRAAQQHVRATGAALASTPDDGSAARMPELRTRLDSALSALGDRQRAAGIDHQAIRDRNERAVARVFVESGTGDVASGSAFSVRTDATLLTSRHLVQGPDGAPARRIAVQFAHSDQVWSARVLAIDSIHDLAIIRADGIIGAVPTVTGFNERADTLARGAPVLMIGFPNGGMSSPSERPGRTRVRPVIGAGTIEAAADDRLDVRGYGTVGSSGSPVFDRDGVVLSIVFGGRHSAGDHILATIPARAAVDLLRTLPPLSPK